VGNLQFLACVVIVCELLYLLNSYISLHISIRDVKLKFF